MSQIITAEVLTKLHLSDMECDWTDLYCTSWLWCAFHLLTGEWNERRWRREGPLHLSLHIDFQSRLSHPQFPSQIQSWRQRVKMSQRHCCVIPLGNPIWVDTLINIPRRTKRGWETYLPVHWRCLPVREFTHCHYSGHLQSTCVDTLFLLNIFVA